LQLPYFVDTILFYMFAIVAIKDKQYKIESGKTIEIDRLEGAVGDKVTFDTVMLRSDDTNTEIGAPYIKGAIVEATIEEQMKGEKLRVSRYKHKVRERRSIGFRPFLTRLMISAIK